MLEVYMGAHAVLCALGGTMDGCMEAMYAGRTGLAYVEEFDAVVGRVASCHFKARDAAHTTRIEFMASRVARECLSKLALPEEALRGTPMLFMTTKGDVQSLAVDSTPAPEAYLEHLALRVAQRAGLSSRPLVLSNACISGELGIIYGSRFLREGKYKRILLVAVDELSRFVVEGFRSFNSLSEKGCRPYDLNRDGLSLGEGAVALILTTEEEEALKPMVKVLGGAISNDANHISGPSRTGDGLALAIEEAIEESQLAVSNIELVNMHGTGTAYNDAMEAKALQMVGVKSVAVVNSLKGFLGHTLGAAGLIETVFTAESLRRGRNLPTCGLRTLGEPVRASSESEGAARRALKTSSGFGGCNAAVVLSMFAEDSVSPHREDGMVVERFRVHLPEVSPEEALPFIKSQFKEVDGKNLKYYKMDSLCKLGYVVAEQLRKQEDFRASYASNAVALLLYNRSSSLESDLKHQHSLDAEEEGGASPSIFVYTLPNVVAGELCIRHHIQGENAFFVGASIADDVFAIAEQTLRRGVAKVVLFGEIEFLRGEYHAELKVLELEK